MIEMFLDIFKFIMVFWLVCAALVFSGCAIMMLCVIGAEIFSGRSK